MPRNSFTIHFYRRSTHKVVVHLYERRSDVRRLVSKVENRKAIIDGACFQPDNPVKTGVVAEIYLSRSHLTLNTIVHECSHAAFHRAVLAGIPLDIPEFQEWVATDTGLLVERMINFFKKEKILLVPETKTKINS